jgi:hypothetical protein
MPAPPIYFVEYDKEGKLKTDFGASAIADAYNSLSNASSDSPAVSIPPTEDQKPILEASATLGANVTQQPSPLLFKLNASPVETKMLCSSAPNHTESVSFIHISAECSTSEHRHDQNNDYVVVTPPQQAITINQTIKERLLSLLFYLTDDSDDDASASSDGFSSDDEDLMDDDAPSTNNTARSIYSLSDTLILADRCVLRHGEEHSARHAPYYL